MFDAYLQTQKQPRWRRKGFTVSASVVLHGGIVGALIFYSFFYVEEVPPPPVSVMFFSAAAPPPPPPAPPKPKLQPKVEKPKVPREVVQPTAVPDTTPDQPEEEPEEPEPGEGVEGSVATGAGGGGGPGPIMPVKPPEPPPVEEKPQFLPPMIGKQQLIDGPEPRLPDEIKSKHAGQTLLVVIKICINRSGAVVGADVVKGFPGVDETVVRTVRRWRYRPYLLDGKPVPVCYPATFIFKIVK